MLARVGTALVWAAVALLWLLAGSAFAAERGGWAGVAFAVSAAVVAGVALVARRREPLAYRLPGDGLVIERRGGELVLRGAVSGGDSCRLVARLFGSGGAYGYWGRFRVGSLAVRAFATDTRKALLVHVGGEHVVVSPADGAAFAGAIGGGDA